MPLSPWESITSIKVLLQRLLELGFQRGSSLFVRGLALICSMRRWNFSRAYGWSEREFLSAFQKRPDILIPSKKAIQDKMEFLVGKAGFEPSYIASGPILLRCSVEKRLMSRYHIMNILKSGELVGEKKNLCTIMRFPEKDFCWKNHSPKHGASARALWGLCCCMCWPNFSLNDIISYVGAWSAINEIHCKLAVVFKCCNMLFLHASY